MDMNLAFSKRYGGGRLRYPGLIYAMANGPWRPARTT